METVKLLLDRSADISAQCGNYGSALQVATSGGNTKIVEVLQFVCALEITENSKHTTGRGPSSHKYLEVTE